MDLMGLVLGKGAGGKKCPLPEIKRAGYHTCRQWVPEGADAWPPALLYTRGSPGACVFFLYFMLTPQSYPSTYDSSHLLLWRCRTEWISAQPHPLGPRRCYTEDLPRGGEVVLELELAEKHRLIIRGRELQFPRLG